MYKKIYAKNGDLKHGAECRMAFGRKDRECPRCLELLEGAQPRESFHKEWTERNNHCVKVSIEEHVNSDAHRLHCGPVCTWGEW
jgi:hypothetical protein